MCKCFVCVCFTYYHFGKKAPGYIKWVFIACMIFSIFRVLYYVVDMDYVFEHFGEDRSTPVFFLNVFVGVIPLIVSFILYKKNKEKMQIRNEFDKMKIRDL